MLSDPQFTVSSLGSGAPAPNLPVLALRLILLALALLLLLLLLIMGLNKSPDPRLPAFELSVVGDAQSLGHVPTGIP